MRKVTSNSIAICILARDCELQLRKNIPKIEAFRQNFAYSKVIVIENDSKDGTKSVLHEWARLSDNIELDCRDLNTLTIPNLDATLIHPGTSLYRISKMASYRNRYISIVESSTEPIDFVIVIDIDVLDFDPMALVKVIDSAPNDWGGIFANGYTNSSLAGKSVLPIYYDMFAFRGFGDFSKPILSFGKLANARKALGTSLKSEAFIKVFSAFGGIGIYRYEAIRGKTYTAERNGDKYIEAVCEHIPFNMTPIERGFCNYISRDLKVYYGKSEPLTVFRSLVPDWFFKFVCFMVRFRRLKE